MQKAIIGKKVGMTQIFDESGKAIPGYRDRRRPLRRRSEEDGGERTATSPCSWATRKSRSPSCPSRKPAT